MNAEFEDRVLSTLRSGRALGLSESETQEVWSAWADAYVASPNPVPLNEVRRALIRRACGAGWHPLSRRKGSPSEEA